MKKIVSFTTTTSKLWRALEWHCIIAGTSISISSPCMACFLQLISCVAVISVAYKCDASLKKWEDLVVFLQQRKTAHQLSSWLLCAPHIQALPSEGVFHRTKETNIEKKLPPAVKTPLWWEMKKSTLSVAERFKACRLSGPWSSFFIVLIYDGHAWKKLEARPHRSVQYHVGPMPSVYLPSLWRGMKKTSSTTTPFVLLLLYNYYCWFTTTTTTK